MPCVILRRTTTTTTTMPNTIKLRSSDDETFEVDEDVAFLSETIRSIIEDTDDDAPVPLPNVNAKILSKVIEYCKFQVKATKENESEAKIKEFNNDFVKVDQATLFEIILAANYLNMKGLLDLTCMTVANMMKGKTPEEIRKTFNIKNDFTAEEEEEVRKENQWAFD